MSQSAEFIIQFNRKPAVLRGPQAWSDCALGYEFQAGGEGDEFKDVVIYNGQFWYCHTTHIKTMGNYPRPTASEDSPWRLGDSIEMVATNILLANYAVIENLGVRAIEMKDADGNVLFTAKDGAVTCNIGNFDSINVTNATFENLTLKGSSTIDYLELDDDECEGVTHAVITNEVARVYASANGKDVTMANILTPGVPNTTRELEIFIRPAVANRSVQLRTFSFIPHLIDFYASAGDSIPTYAGFTTEYGSGSLVSGGYIRMILKGSNWEIVQRSGNIKLIENIL